MNLNEFPLEQFKNTSSNQQPFPVIITPQEKNHTFDTLPHHIVDNNIFSYLNSKDLFFTVRPVCTEWYDLMKSIWCNKLKEEMIDHVKTIDFLYEKEVLTKTYEFKLEYLYNYKNLLMLYNSNLNIISVIGSSFQETDLQEIVDEKKKLFALYFGYFNMQDAKELVLSNQAQQLKDYCEEEESINHYKEMFNYLIAIENTHTITESEVNIFKNDFNQLNKNLIEDSGENNKLIYSLLQGMIEFELLKYDIKDLIVKQKAVIKKIQSSTNEWPKKKKFFERAYKLMVYTK